MRPTVRNPWESPYWAQCNAIMVGAAVGGLVGQGVGLLVGLALSPREDDLQFERKRRQATYAYAVTAAMGSGFGAALGARHYVQQAVERTLPPEIKGGSAYVSDLPLELAAGLTASVTSFSATMGSRMVPHLGAGSVLAGIAGGVVGAGAGSYAHGIAHPRLDVAGVEVRLKPDVVRPDWLPPGPPGS